MKKELVENNIKIEIEDRKVENNYWNNNAHMWKISVFKFSNNEWILIDSEDYPANEPYNRSDERTREYLGLILTEVKRLPFELLHTFKLSDGW